jgi:hypothetical protein
MTRLDALSDEIAAAEQSLLQRRLLVRLRTRMLAARARRRLASPVALLAAAAAGFTLASSRGRSAIAKGFAALQFALAALSAIAAAK